MAVYGPNAGFVPFTGFTPTLGVDAVSPSTVGNVQFNGLTQQDGTIARLLFTNNNRIIRRLMNVLLGAAPGTTATENRARVTAATPFVAQFQGGGVVPIETLSLINRASTVADDTAITALINRTPVPTYVPDVSGIGGGGNLGF